MSKEVLKLALEALENSVDLVREDAYQAEKLYGNYPTRQGKVKGLKVLADDHEKAITSLREALAEQPAPVQQEPVAIALNTGTKQGVKWLKNVEHGEHLYTSPPAQQEPKIDIYRSFEQWKSGNVLEHGVPRTEHYSEAQLDLVEMGWNYGYDAGRAVEQALDKKAENARELGLDYEPAKQGPVAEYIGECSDGSLVQLYDDVKKGTKFYTSPPAQRTWVGLTDEEIARVVSLAGFAPDWVEAHIAIQIVRVLEAKLKEKNNG